jgi:uroporphyrinogen decarboxylase
VFLEAVRHCVAEVGDEVFVGCCFAAPFTTAACLRGTDVLARDLFRNRELATRLVELSLEATLPLVDAIADAGGVPAIVDPVATGSMLSEELFRTYALPYLIPLVDAIHARGLPALVHVCGKTTRLLEALADTGADIVSLDIVDLAVARERIGDRITLMGNVRPAQTLLEGTPQDVEREVIECLRKAGSSPRGFIISSGCEVPVAAPAENLEAMMAAADKWARLPLELPA